MVHQFSFLWSPWAQNRLRYALCFRKKTALNAGPSIAKSKEQGETKVSAVAAKRLSQSRQEVDGKRIICPADGGFTNQTVFRNLPENCAVIGRIRKDARLFLPPDESAQVRWGRKKFYGKPLPTPQAIRQNEPVPWRQVKAYAAEKNHQSDVKVMPAVRWKGSGEHMVQVVIIRPLHYRLRKGARMLYRDPVYLICTDPHLPLDGLGVFWAFERLP